MFTAEAADVIPPKFIALGGVNDDEELLLIREEDGDVLAVSGGSGGRIAVFVVLLVGGKRKSPPPLFLASLGVVPGERPLRPIGVGEGQIDGVAADDRRRNAEPWQRRLPE